MWRLQTTLRPRVDSYSLEAQAACAGIALACAYSTSEEYEAAVILERRKSGAYGSEFHRRHVLMLATATTTVFLFFITL